VRFPCLCLCRPLGTDTLLAKRRCATYGGTRRWSRRMSHRPTGAAAAREVLSLCRQGPNVVERAAIPAGPRSGRPGGVAWGHSLGCRPIWATAAVKLGGRPFGELRPALAWRDDLREPAAAPDRGSPGWCRAAWSARVHLSVMRRRPDRASTVRDDAGLVNTRVPCSMTTGRRFAAANTVFTWTKSTVRMLLACAARNCFLVGHRRQIGHGTRVRAPAVHRRVCHLRHRRHHHPPHPALAGKRQTPVSKTPVIAPDQATGKDHSHDMAAR